MASERDKSTPAQDDQTKAQDKPVWVDATKFTQVYANMHKLAAKDPDENVVYDFSGASDEILNFTHDKFGEYPDLIPHNVTLQFKKTGSSQTQLLGIQGTGPIDVNYTESVKKIGELSKPITENADFTRVTPLRNAQNAINSSLYDFQIWRSQRPAIKIATLQSEIATLKADFDQTVQSSITLSDASKNDMREKLDILIENVKNEISSLNQKLENAKDQPDYSKLHKKADDLLKTIAAVKTFVKDGVKPLAQGIILDKENSKNNKESAIELAQTIKAAENACKSEIMKLSVGQKIITGVSAFLGAVGAAMLGFVGGLLVGGPIGAAAGTALGGITGGTFGMKVGEKVSFRGHPVKTAAKDFVESARGQSTGGSATKPIENSSDHRPK